MLEHDPGLPASPPVRYILKVPRSGYFPLLNPFIVRCWKDKSFAKRQPLSARLAGTSSSVYILMAFAAAACGAKVDFGSLTDFSPDHRPGCAGVEVHPYHCVGSRWFWKLVMQQVLGSTARRLADAATDASILWAAQANIAMSRDAPPSR
jgi:hypothetical protein